MGALESQKPPQGVRELGGNHPQPKTRFGDFCGGINGEVNLDLDFRGSQ